MKIIQLDQPIDDPQRAEHLFRGELLVFRNIPAMRQLIDRTDQLLRDKLSGLDPVRAQHRLSPQDFLQLTGEVQSEFRKSQWPKDLFFAALQQCGVELSETFYDHFPLRVVPFDRDSDGSHNGAHRAAIGHHRDSWGANIFSQINWWAPIYSLEAERSIAFYPDYWDRPLANNTDSWCFEDYLAERRKVPEERRSAYPSAPQPLEVVDESGVEKILIEPGDILCFASAQLHASVPNSTDATRFSVEMRTINRQDLQAGRAAPNVDNAATTPMHRWFRGIVDKQPLELKIESISPTRKV
ncbi:phytanoyl-CoA dioxygenase family protein [Marinobacterium jannaschii]|uniref:hypothetical protein n=1 Tax=Marinobacterium jannaschii TaxID=64970 RepID=UPI000687D9D1|nr:hypothetical protein [Marinobacterium jannaschii]